VKKLENKNNQKKLRKVKSVKKVNDSRSEESTSNKKNKKKKGKKGWKIFKIFLFIGIALMIVGAGIVLGIVTGIVDKTDSISPEELKNLEQTSFVYDKDNNKIGSFSDSQNRVLVKYKDIPQSVIDAVVAIEDERFFSHKGVDIKRTAAAIATYILNGGDSNFGGSTITQQLIKNISDDDEKSWVRKIREWYRAFNIETVLSKEEIFTSYVNTIYLGDGCYGIQAASQNYFGKPVSEVDLAQSAILAAIIQSPEATNPYRSDEAKEKLLERQKVVLDKMLSLGKITDEEYEEAVAEEIKFEKADDEDDSSGEVQSYFVDAVFEAVLQDLMEEKDINEATATILLYTGGYNIYTTMDSKVQSVIDSAYANDTLFYEDSDGAYMQSAMVVIEQSTGNVVGLIGGAGEKTGARSFNRATDAKRQPGSCMKPIAAYGPAFEKGVLSPGAGLDDSQLTDVTGWDPGNYYGYFNGYVTARNAIAKSMNLPAVRALRKVGVEYAYNFAKSLGLYNLQESDKSLSMALGGIGGVTVMEMANAYATFANGGMYIEPKLYTLVTDSEGNEVLNNNKANAKVVMKESTAFMITSCLQTVVTNGTATGYVKMNTAGIDVAGKTGNTNDDLDQWFCGYTPYYTIACWNGYDNNEKSIGTRKIGSYPYTSVNLFNTVMNGICEGKEAATFNKPDSVTTAELCQTSGLVATDACKKDQRGSQVGSDLVDKNSIPTETCTVHKMAKVCTVSGLLASSSCKSTVEKSFITRDGTPTIKPSDWSYMLPTSTCDKCKSQSKTSSDDVNIYDDVEPITKTTIINKNK
jgi:penicillin-binding protein 1A